MAKKLSRIRPTSLPSPIPGKRDRERRVRQADRLARILKVLNLIQSRGRWNTRTIAEELECSERTIHRDLKALEFAGVPYFFDQRQQCYRVREDYRFPTLMLTEMEAVGQSVATTLTNSPGLNVGIGASATTRKLAAVSHAQVQQILSDATRLVEVFNLKLVDHSRHQEILKTIQFALLQQKQLTGTYDSPYEPQTVKLTIHPYRLCLIKQAWYLIGRLEGDPIPKTFRIARFKSLRMLDQPAQVPDSFDLQEYLGNAWGVYRGDQSYDVELKFFGTAAKIVTETNWHHTQQVQAHKSGDVTIRFRVDGLDEILRWVLTWTGQMVIVGPVELKQRFHETLQSGLDMHS